MKSGKNTALAAIGAGIACIAVMLVVLGSAISAEDGKISDRRLMGIMYHQVLKDESKSGRYIITPAELEADLAYLSKNGFTSVLPSDIVNVVDNNGVLPEKCVMITFDDGYETGLYYVLPLLEKYNMKAVINIVGSYTDKYTEIDCEGEHLSYAYLTWDEVKRLSDSGRVEIGSHTYNMHNDSNGRKGCSKLPGETDEEYRRALLDDLSALSEKLLDAIGKKPLSFAYPYGIISEGSEEIAAKTGARVLMTCCELPTIINDGERIVINRYNRESGRTVGEIYTQYLQSL